MRRSEKAILGLIAQGRITAAEAERLLAAAGEGREAYWLAAAALVAAAAARAPPGAWLAGVAHGIQETAPLLGEILQRFTVLALHIWGGLQ